MKLDFQPIKLSDKEALEPFLLADGAIMSDRCFASLYVWGEHYALKRCIAGGFLFLLSESGDRLIYYMPLGGGDMKDALCAIAEHAAGRDYVISLITEQGRARMEACGGFEFTEDRDDFDYVYDAQAMISLAGKHLHAKRNFINRFLKEHEGAWSYVDVNPERDRAEILAFLREWCEHKNDQTDDYKYEYSAIQRALDSWSALGMKGGILETDGRLCAFTMAAKQGETVMDILIEKADPNMEGAYTMINNSFASLHCKDCVYINREEDLGIKGLRAAKMSYHPVMLTVKYTAVPKP